MNNWTLRLHQSQRQRQTNSKELLPLPRDIRDGLSLQYHLHLEILRAGRGTLFSLQLLMRVALGAAMLQQLGYGKSMDSTIEALEDAAKRALDSWGEGEYRFDAETYRHFARLVTHHDGQLEHAPVKALSYVETKLAQYSKAA